MDAFADATSSTTVLPYDDDVLHEARTSPLIDAPETSEGGRSLADRIGTTKVYLLSDASKSRVGKRKHEDDDDDDEDPSGDVEMSGGEPSSVRDNAILLHGSPIAHLPTSNIFAYATHFDAHPLGLEWIDDTTCILVFETKHAARSAFRTLQKSLAEEPSVEDGSITAKPIPVTIWPVEYRINATLGKGEGLKGILRMRWARVEDVKKRGAKNQSQFYRKYGENAGKGLDEGPRPAKRPRGKVDVNSAMRKAQLDAELDRFLAEDEDVRPPSPPSKMRSDYVGDGGKTLLERTAGGGGLVSRLQVPLPRRARSRRGGQRAWDRGKDEEGYEDRYEPRSRRPKPTQEELDAELDAFLEEKL